MGCFGTIHLTLQTASCIFELSRSAGFLLETNEPSISEAIMFFVTLLNPAERDAAKQRI